MAHRPTLLPCSPEERIHSLGHAQSYEAAIALTVIERPDLLLMETGVRTDGAVLDAARVIIGGGVATCIVLLADRDDAEFERTARALGVARVVVKPIDSQTLSGIMTEVYADHCSRIPPEFQQMAEEDVG